MGDALTHSLNDASADARYLSQLGERVRAWRAEHGVTRRALAANSGVSERYLAQLETGHGNVSVLLLRRIARAMNVSADELVRERVAAPERSHLARFIDALPEDRLASAHRLLLEHFGSPRRRRIALIGLRGAGKSTLGAQLAANLGVPFIELDREVEREAGAALGEVFSMYGQEAFRRFERRALERVLGQHDRAVIATGGSLATDPQSYELLLGRCFCVWLRASPEEHMSRVIAQGDMRPFRGRSAALDEIRRLLADRDELYARADAAVDTSGKPLKHCLAELEALAVQTKEKHR